MDKIVAYFGHIPSWQRSLILVGGLVLFWILEGLIPLSRARYPKFRHAIPNLFLTLTTVVINFAFAWLIVMASRHAWEHQAGLLYVVRLPLWLFGLLGLLLLDLISAWFIHWLQHQVSWMWKLHLIHHSDTRVDTTTANRHHPGESILRAIFTLLAVLVTGAPLWLVFLYQSLSVFLAQFNHANIVLPKWLDRGIGLVIVSPDMHKVHHHFRQPLTDTNYGNIFSFWDRIFRTYVEVKDARTLQYGIDSYIQEGNTDHIGRLLTNPFHEQLPVPGSKFNKEKG